MVFDLQSMRDVLPSTNENIFKQIPEIINFVSKNKNENCLTKTLFTIK